MRKRLVTPTAERIRARGEGWLDVERAAVVEVTSEDKDFRSSRPSSPGMREDGVRQRRAAKRFD